MIEKIIEHTVTGNADGNKATIHYENGERLELTLCRESPCLETICLYGADGNERAAASDGSCVHGQDTPFYQSCNEYGGSQSGTLSQRMFSEYLLAMRTYAEGILQWREDGQLLPYAEKMEWLCNKLAEETVPEIIGEEKSAPAYLHDGRTSAR